MIISKQVVAIKQPEQKEPTQWHLGIEDGNRIHIFFLIDCTIQVYE